MDRWARPAGEAGFTLVEVIVSLTIIAVGVVGVMGVMESSFGVAVESSRRARAVAIATGEVETMRAVPYDDLVVEALARTRSVIDGGNDYLVETAVTWRSVLGRPTAYKLGTVAVSWSEGRGSRSVRQSSYFYPGGLGPQPDTSTPPTCQGAPTQPRSLTASPTTGSGAEAIDVSWQSGAASATPIAHWAVERSTTGSGTWQLLADQVPASTLLYRAAGLAPATGYTFRLAAVSPCGTRSAWSDPVSTSTDATAVTACTLGTPNISPARVKLQNGSKSAPLSTAPVVTIPASGACSDFTVRYAPVAGVTMTLPMTFAGGNLSATLDRTGPWDIEVHQVDVLRASTVSITLLLTVCAHNSGACG